MHIDTLNAKPSDDRHAIEADAASEILRRLTAEPMEPAARCRADGTGAFGCS